MSTALNELRQMNVAGQRGTKRQAADTEEATAAHSASKDIAELPVIETTGSSVVHTTSNVVAQNTGSSVVDTTDPLKAAYIAHLMHPIPPVPSDKTPEMKVTTIKVRKEIFDKLKSAASLTGLDQQDIIGQALTDYYLKLAKKGGK